jgi:hypothetical protein
VSLRRSLSNFTVTDSELARTLDIMLPLDLQSPPVVETATFGLG